MKPTISLNTGFFVPSLTKNQEYQAFWQWFQANLPALQQHVPQDDDILAALAAQAKTINEHLLIEIQPGEDTPYQLLISADGFRSAFPDVIGLFRCAPEIANWRVIPFRPRMDIQHHLHFEGKHISADSLWYRTEILDGVPAIYLYIDGLTEDNSDELSGATYSLLDMALGEYDVETKIGLIELRPLHDFPDPSQLKHINQLCNDIDAFYHQH